MRSPDAIWRLMDEIFSDLRADLNFDQIKPLLAHYTTAAVLEQIVKNSEIWFGNPLFMNDLEEIRFGINEGTRALSENEHIRSSFANASDAKIFEDELWATHQNFDENHVFDTYIICFSEHSETDTDGMLSMWRGYGDSGKGAAVIFDGRSLQSYHESPLVISKVEYATRSERYAWFEGLAQNFAKIVSTRRLHGEEIRHACSALFARLRLYSLFSKDIGFREEKEWRLAYLPERDIDGKLAPFLSYYNGVRGIEPKLKLPITSNPAFGDQQISLEKLVHSIILGPSASTALAILSTQRMLRALGKPELVNKIVGSSIPYRTY